MTPSEILCSRFSFSRAELFEYASTCPYRYKKYYIEKRGGRGVRLIAQPSKDLKVVQRIILKEFFRDKLKVHKCATAYKIGSSILKNAEPHLANEFLLKMDFKNFFPSLKAGDFDQFLQKGEILNDENERALLCQIFFINSPGDNVLSIGSPGSPVISNAMLFGFDQALSERCQNAGITYTRYSDDMTFSTNERELLFSWPREVDGILNDLSQIELSINAEKTVFSSRKFNRHITGITITNDGKASLGRTKKREIRTRVFLTGQGVTSREELLSLNGYISFAKSVEPLFVTALLKKYPLQMELIQQSVSAER